MVEWQPDVIYSLRAHQRGGNMSFLVKYHNGYWTIREEHIQNGAVVMHAGPVMRNQDISDDVLSSPNCYVREQVQTGLRVRQAVLRMYS
jgi:aspartate carbamoyltransferase catalytic subunit